MATVAVAPAAGRRRQWHSANAERPVQLEALYGSERKIWLAAVRAEREELMQMREQNVINDELMRILEGDIDLEEALISGASRHGH